MLNAGIVDLLIVVIANLSNLILAGIFYARLRHSETAERLLGIVFIIAGVPLILLIANNFVQHRDIWTIYLPVPLLLFMLVELALDYINKKPWRNTWLLGPYLLIYYVGLFGMIGYSFRVNKIYGFITLITYFLQMGLSMLALKKVGHDQ